MIITGFSDVDALTFVRAVIENSWPFLVYSRSVSGCNLIFIIVFNIVFVISVLSNIWLTQVA